MKNKYYTLSIFDLIVLLSIVVLSFIIFLRISSQTMLIGGLLIAFGYRFQFDRKIIKGRNPNFDDDEDISRKLYFFNFFSIVFMLIGLIVFIIGFFINHEINYIFVEALFDMPELITTIIFFIFLSLTLISIIFKKKEVLFVILFDSLLSITLISLIISYILI